MASIPKKVDEFVSMSKFKEYLKVYLVLKYKGFSWKKELQNAFSIADSIVNDGLKVLEREGFVISKDFWSLDSDLQEIIKRTSAAYFDKINSYPKVYILNQDEIRDGWYECNKDDIEKLIKGDGSMLHTLKLVGKQKVAYDKLKKKFDFIENTRYERFRLSSDGILYVTDTKKKKNFDSSLKMAVLKRKKEFLFLNEKIALSHSKQNLKVLENNLSDLSLSGELSLNNSQVNLNLKQGVDLKVSLNGENISDQDYDLLIKEKKKEDLLFEKNLNKDLKLKQIISVTKSNNLKFNDHWSELKSLPQINGYGILIEDLDNESIDRVKKWDNFFGISKKKDSYEFNSLKEKKKALELVSFLFNKLRTGSSLDIFYVQSHCGSENIFNYFLYMLNNSGGEFIFDGEEFNIV